MSVSHRLTELEGESVEPRVDRRCRFCGSKLARSVVDLGKSPLANAFLTAADLDRPEKFYPLHVFICDQCHLVQLQAFESPQNIFGHYLYFSSYSESWLDHCRAYADAMTRRYALDGSSLVVELASNDGGLLRFFQERGVPVLGIEPAANIAAVARQNGIPTEVAFFGRDEAARLVASGQSADLIAANNVLAHVPDLNDFVAGCSILLKRQGTATFEFPYLLNLIVECQFDTIYHEHFSYFSLAVAQRLFAKHGLQIFDVERLATHGGSVRVHVAHSGANRACTAQCNDLLSAERAAGLDRFESYRKFADAVIDVKCALVKFLCEARRAGKTVAGYGAPAKASTLLNFCGVGRELLPYTVDRSTHKQGRYLPGVQIPIYEPEHILEAKPDYVLILPWNIKDEITSQMAVVRSWGGKFVTAIPGLSVF